MNSAWVLDCLDTFLTMAAAIDRYHLLTANKCLILYYAIVILVICTDFLQVDLDAQIYYSQYP